VGSITDFVLVDRFGKSVGIVQISSTLKEALGLVTFEALALIWPTRSFEIVKGEGSLRAESRGLKGVSK